MRRYVLMIASMVAAAMLPALALAEVESFKPSKAAVQYMVKNLSDDSRAQRIFHPAFGEARQIVVRDLDDEGHGVEAFFYMRDNWFWWQYAIRLPRTDGEEGIDTRIYEFSVNDMGSVFVADLFTGLMKETSPARMIHSSDPEWPHAMSVSRKAWEMLCNKFGCDTPS